MQHSKLKISLAAVSTLGVALTIAAQPAFADYAPTSSDFVGVGSDTVQYAGDFAADGDNNGDAGYNKGKLAKVINFDATPDANARLAYGPDGVGNGSTTACAPGTGGTAGTGDATAKHKDQPCTLNPTIVLKTGTKPVQRPNGSGAGAKAINNDPSHLIGYTRASSAQGGTLVSQQFDSITIGIDKLALIAQPGGHAVQLSANQLNTIYSCQGGTGANGVVTWSDVGGSSNDPIIPIVPQIGSGTRQTFLRDIGHATTSGTYVESGLGTCVVTSEENDPTAIQAQGTTGALDAIEPMSGGRLNMFQGILGATGASNDLGGYFTDPSCSLNAINAAKAASSFSDPCYPGDATHPAQDLLSPNVAFLTGNPLQASGTGLNVGSLASGPYFNNRNLYIYFRDADLNSATPAQASGASGNNWVRSLFYDPCTGLAATPCTADPVAGNVGKFGTPFYATTTGQNDISEAGILPSYAETNSGP